MKELLSIVMSVMFSVFSGLEIIAPKADAFLLNTPDAHSYWSPGSATTISDAELYRQQFKAIDERHPCETGNTIPTRTEADQDAGGWSSATPHYPCADIKGNWIDSAEMVDVGASCGFDGWSSANELPTWASTPDTDWLWTCPENTGDMYIVAPVTGKLLSSHFACDYGQSLDFEFSYTIPGQMEPSTYKMSIRNAKCWWCCRNKPVPSNGCYTAATDDSLKGREMPAGTLLCIGKPGTKVTISYVN